MQWTGGDATMGRSASNAVIIVEDDVGLTQALTRILRLGGLSPVTYTSAEALLASDGVEQAMCLILDVQLPGINGFALRERLLAQHAIPPVVFITAFDEPEARSEAMRAGASFLAKPFSGRVLLETIRQMQAVSS